MNTVSFADPATTQLLHSVIDDEFALIATVTFFLCEAVFNAFPVYRARMKQLTSLLIGGVLGVFLIPESPGMAFVQGFLAGGATTMLVAKFKKPSSSTVVASTVSKTPIPDTGDVHHI